MSSSPGRVAAAVNLNFISSHGRWQGRKEIVDTLESESRDWSEKQAYYERLLRKAGGLFVDMVPDRNCTFIYYRPNSSPMEILSVSESQTRHAMRLILLSRTTTRNDAARDWLEA